MQSQADIIYNHINSNIEKIEIDHDKNLVQILNQHRYKTSDRTLDRVIENEEAIKKIELNSIILMPHFLKEVSKREKELGLNIRLWQPSECAKFDEWFMNKYRHLIW